MASYAMHIPGGTAGMSKAGNGKGEIWIRM